MAIAKPVFQGRSSTRGLSCCGFDVVGLGDHLAKASFVARYHRLSVRKRD